MKCVKIYYSYDLELTCFTFEICQSFEAVRQDLKWFSKPVRHTAEIQMYKKYLTNFAYFPLHCELRILIFIPPRFMTHTLCFGP